MHTASDNIHYLNQIISIQNRLAEANFNVENFMNLVVEEVQNITLATGVVVELVEGEEMVYKAATGTVKQHVGLRINRQGSISGLCVETKEILRSDDTENDPRVNVAACRLVQARSMVVAPLFHEGKSIGVIKILSKEPSNFKERDVQTLQIMAGLIGSALAHQIYYQTTEKLLNERTQALKDLKKAQKKLKEMALHDFLTKLPNRNLFTDILNIAINRSARSAKLLALFFLDIDHFKHINDTYGHDVGDQLLKAFAARISKCIRKSDTAARLGGDEFVILLDELPHEDIAIMIANNIIKTMANAFQFQTTTINISTSIGISFYKSSLNADEFIKTADEALYIAKESGRNNFKIYNSTNES